MRRVLAFPGLLASTAAHGSFEGAPSAADSVRSAVKVAHSAMVSFVHPANAFGASVEGACSTVDGFGSSAMVVLSAMTARIEH